MTKIALVSDTTADLPENLREKMDIKLADAYVHFNNMSYVMSNMTLEEFHDKMENADKSNFPKTSQPTAADILEIYENLKDDGYDVILSIHVAQKLSGTINSANVAKGMIDDIDIRIIDSQGVSVNLIACLQKAHQLIQQEKDIDEIVREVENFGKSLSAYFSLNTMENLVRGGRISPIRYFLGRILNIKPVLELNNGEIKPFDKARGLEKSREIVYSTSTGKYSKDEKFYYILAHTRQEEYAKKIQKRLSEEFPKAEGFIIEIGIVVATHAGKGAFLLLTYNL